MGQRRDSSQVVYVDGDVPQLPIQLGQLLVDSSQIAPGTTNLQQCTSQSPLVYEPLQGGYPALSFETSVVNSLYYYGDIRRYGAVGDDATDCTAAIQAAINQQANASGYAVHIPQGTFRTTAALTGTRGLTMRGANKYRSIIHAVGAINFLTFVGTLGNPDGSAFVFSDFCVKGSSSSLNHLELSSAGQASFERMKFWLTGASFVNFDTLNFNISFSDCLFQSWKTAAVRTNGLNSVLAFRNCEFSISGSDGILPTVGTSASVSLGDGELITFDTCNTNGDSSLANFLRIRGGAPRLHLKNCYTEFLTGSSIRTEAAGLISGMMIDGANFTCADSVAIDLATSNPAHSGIIIRNVRRSDSGVCFIFDPGTGTTDFDYAGIPLDGSADHVVGYPNKRAVRKYIGGRIDRDGQMTSVSSLSGTTTAGANLRGGDAFVTTALTRTITFATAEADASYRVIITPTSDWGAQTKAPWISGKSTSGFTVNVQATTSSGTFDWALIR